MRSADEEVLQNWLGAGVDGNVPDARPSGRSRQENDRGDWCTDGGGGIGNSTWQERYFFRSMMSNTSRSRALPMLLCANPEPAFGSTVISCDGRYCLTRPPVMDPLKTAF